MSNGGRDLFQRLMDAQRVYTGWLNHLIGIYHCRVGSYEVGLGAFSYRMRLCSAIIPIRKDRALHLVTPNNVKSSLLSF